MVKYKYWNSLWNIQNDQTKVWEYPLKHTSFEYI